MMQTVEYHSPVSFKLTECPSCLLCPWQNNKMPVPSAGVITDYYPSLDRCMYNLIFSPYTNHTSS